MQRQALSIAGFVFRLSPLLLVAPPALAYVGPGAGLSALGSVLALIGAFLLLLVGFVWYPMKRLLRSFGFAKGADANTGDGAKPEDSTDAVE